MHLLLGRRLIPNQIQVGIMRPTNTLCRLYRAYFKVLGFPYMVQSATKIYHTQSFWNLLGGPLPNYWCHTGLVYNVYLESVSHSRFTVLTIPDLMLWKFHPITGTLVLFTSHSVNITVKIGGKICPSLRGSEKGGMKTGASLCVQEIHPGNTVWHMHGVESVVGEGGMDKVI